MHWSFWTKDRLPKNYLLGKRNDEVAEWQRFQ
jgi:hypothetical protein